MKWRDVCTTGSTSGETHGINKLAVGRPEAGETPGSDVEDFNLQSDRFSAPPNGAGIDFWCSFSIGRKKKATRSKSWRATLSRCFVRSARKASRQFLEQYRCLLNQPCRWSPCTS